jgi:hypothetical protein
MPDHNTITRAFAWARAYLEVQNTMAAKMCLRRVMKTNIPADMGDLGQGAVQLAADIATQYIVGGDVHEAAEILRVAALWTRGELDVRSEAGEEKTVIARKPLQRLPAPKPPPQPEQARDELTEPVPHKRALETRVGREEDDVTRIYRAGKSRTASGTVTTHTIRCVRPDIDTLS